MGGCSVLSESIGYIKSPQSILFGCSENKEVVGFGGLGFSVSEISRHRANEIVKKNHYSKKFYSASYIHLAVFSNGEIKGVLQFGYAMNPQSMGSVVKGSELKEYLELNRMWLDDSMPRNSESKAISYSIKYIRRKYPDIAWVQSFADERCGRFGVVYQASSFLYCGEHLSVFWELDGVFYHNSLMTRRPELSKSAKMIQDRKGECIKHEFRQFRYIKCLKKWARKNLLLDVKEYPKPEKEKKK